ncbi:MAG TPA: MBL fold metallo-hydrolase, partial [Candidatus Woesebacteria bacterium]|nr:MBL fold metallo-hydrolase [Candidatus Woesebacteria bacterium]
LIDLGMFQGTPEIDALNYQPYTYDCSQLVGAVLTHAHLDHCGRLPILLPKGYKDKIWMTPATRDLTEISLLDSAQIAVDDKKKLLYDKNLAYKTIDRFKTQEYRTEFQVGDFAVTFRDAGHILGSAILEIEDKRPNSDSKKIVFSGDIGNYPEDLVLETEQIDSADVVIMESTYGDRLHPEEDASAMLQKEINAIESSGGTLLIPAFALERTQELLHMIMHLKKEGKIKASTPVFLDSPMAQKATMVYADYPQLFNKHVVTDIENEGAFDFIGLEMIEKRSKSRGLHFHNGPQVIIAGSGMMTGGRIVSHAAYYLGNEKNRLLIVGYQGEETLGRALMEGKKQVEIEGVQVDIKASITTTHAMSSHADQQQLMDWLQHIQGVKKVILTHGEDQSRETLSQKITQELGISDVELPHLHEEIQF